ncbi:ABC transporter substrate-binding protein [Zavarzinia compransoris]|uniref:ABC transporter substrate-binding protein n=2 Tax=Zavarzinia compransoris TaxID=1264899 RepID=A0A317E0F1_9PROT|nr:ABC transporter substrate-binding protein [Zavarzinia compransoris]
MNLCADELVLRLADPGQVASVSYLAADRRISTVADLAAGLPLNHGLAEEVVRHGPDLVIAGKYTTRTTVALLRRFGLPVLDLDVPVTFDAVAEQIREVAAALEQPARGEALIAAITAGLAAVPARARPLRALVLRPNGVTAGRGSLVDTLLVRAGLVNLGAGEELQGYSSLPLERVVGLKPDLLILDSDPYPAPALAYDVLRHPVLQDLPFDLEVIGVPNRLWTCAGPGIVEALGILAGEGYTRLSGR